MEENEEVEAKTGTHQLPQIPEEIVLRILSKLPVKSLLRFRCVSNRWRFLISDPSFTLSTPRHQIVVMPRINWTVSPFHMIDDEGSVVEIPKPNPLMSRFCCLSIEGSCNGLLLLGAQGDFFLWNPSTGSCNVNGVLHTTGRLIYGFAMTHPLMSTRPLGFSMTFMLMITGPLW